MTKDEIKRRLDATIPEDAYQSHRVEKLADLLYELQGKPDDDPLGLKAVLIRQTASANACPRCGGAPTAEIKTTSPPQYTCSVCGQSWFGTDPRAYQLHERLKSVSAPTIEVTHGPGITAKPPTRSEEIAEKLHKSGAIYANGSITEVAAAIDTARAEMREACAKIAERHTVAYGVPCVDYQTTSMAYCIGHEDGAKYAAKQIRALH